MGQIRMSQSLLHQGISSNCSQPEFLPNQRLGSMLVELAATCQVNPMLCFEHWWPWPAAAAE